MSSTPIKHSAAGSRRRRGILGLVSDFFNSIWLGIFLVIAILVYGTLGSAVPPVRQFFELTEFQYFNHWVFFGLILLFCVNLTVATFRRIKFNRINAGVLTVHTGLLILCYGSVVYFGNKIEGDVWLGTPTVKIYSIDRFKTDRENSVVGQLPAIEGEVWEQNIPMLGGRHRLEVLEVRHEGLETGSYVKLKGKIGDEPEKVYELNLGASDQLGHIAQFSSNFAIMLHRSPETNYFYDDTTPALIIPLGESRANWAYFELPNLPYYHERFVTYSKDDPVAADLVSIKGTDGASAVSGRLKPIPLVERWRMPFDVIPTTSAIASDWPITITVDGYLPYAEMDQHPMPGGDRLFPISRISYDHGHDPHEEWFAALSPVRSAAEFHDGTRVEFAWVGEATSLDPSWSAPIEGRHVLSVHVKDANVRRSYDVTAGQVLPVEGTDYTLTIDELRPSWPLMTKGFENARTAIALVVVKRGDVEIQRSVLQRFPSLNQDRYPQNHPDESKRGKRVDDQRSIVDENIELQYFDAATDHVLVAAGRNYSPTMIHTAPGGKRTMQRIEFGKPIDLGQDKVVTLHELIENPRLETQPVVIPKQNRRSLMDVRRANSAIRLLLRSKDGKWSRHVWLPFSQYNGDNLLDPVQPTVVSDVPSLGEIRLMYGRATRGLPTTMTLERLQTDMYPGEMQARDWTSLFRYRDPETGQVRRGRAFLNNTYSIGDWTFFQARASGDHKSWTILGVGNRRGVWTMLAGCTLISLGMVYAFAVKPALVKRRRDRIQRG